jgi:hypothetical protein
MTNGAELWHLGRGNLSLQDNNGEDEGNANRS